MLRSMLLTTALATLALPVAAPAAGNLTIPRLAHRPGIRIWTSHGEVYQRGERVRVYYRTERDAYVTLLRVDTDGRVRVLYPREPFEDNLSAGGRTYTVGNHDNGSAFYVDDDPGVGYIFGVASDDPFLYDAISGGDSWDMHVMSDARIHGDPYSALEELIQQIVPEGYLDFDTHLLPYYVERRYEYPRFACYDCHAYVGYSLWNPYRLYCSRFTLWVYTDPYYFYPSYWYPTVYYGGTRVVYVRPGPREGRYVFKTRDASAPGIGYRDRRGEQVLGGDRRPADRGVRGVDIGGVGTVAAPGVPGSGRRFAPPGEAAPGRTFGTPDNPLYVGPDARRRVPSASGQAPQPGTAGDARGEKPGAVRRGIVTDPGGLDRPVRREPVPDEGGARGARPDVREGRGATPAPQRDARPERREEPRFTPDRSARPERTESPRAEPRQEPQRSEPRAAPQRSEPQRSEPRAAPQRSEPRAAPRSEPRASAPRSSPPPRSEPRAPSPSLVRRRG